ncbi:class I SAM-dependent methyltransferase [Allofrancisella guangzhouensis]|uniref:Methyltransferase n=1 Tax=Allofrancisella guangzhouensis TaxID=594679 RepID=A0A0A8E9F2_9GAMM|nr:hypothetical protein [Allofrancisella guangzhouensis]AJC48806.1 hypothetical protein SD28_03735 [Allofrancisella guangzhouensis]MBK2027143.1 class I SAM-dependent methyltransferase [Allofrancisella guangzhouensis]MBK2044481.1 class I SAM-dependent methyltransferase [Allofrancisella guangzhouensis]MBK2046026.1 class I SAM-dependent methyltransferase [Allofrancisella guangzhouensis]
MTVKDRIIIKYLQQRWYKKTLVITNLACNYASKIKSLKTVICSGYLETNKNGCIFDICAWPFEPRFFDLIIIDGAFVDARQEQKALLNQLYFCLSDDGEIIVAGTTNVRAYRLVSKFLSNGFLNKKIELLINSDSALINLFKRIFSKKFIAFFKKDNFFKIDPLEVSELFEKPAKCEAYSSVNAKGIYKDSYEKK